MKRNWLSLAFLSLIILACAFGAQGQNPTLSQAPSLESSTNQISSQVTAAQYAQYYTMQASNAAPGTHIVAPEKFEITGNAPSTVYLANQEQPVAYSQYLTFPDYKGSNSLWIMGQSSWTRYANVPQGAFLSLIAISPSGGNGYLYEIYPDGRLVKNSYLFYPSNRIGFYADTVGQHILLFAIEGQVSNPIVIDVSGYNPPVYSPPVYYPPIDVPQFPLCLDGRLPCNGECCPQGQVCINGDCRTPSTCPDGRNRCDGECCPQGQVCINGDCRTPTTCPGGRERCDGECCPQGQVCINGNCTTPSSCPDGRNRCDGECCPQGQVCINGDCRTPSSCPGGRERCDGECCPQGQVCINGDCRTPSCPDGRNRCDGECCPQGQVCINGDCRTPSSCPDGRNRCDGECCPQGQFCINGDCRTLGGSGGGEEGTIDL